MPGVELRAIDVSVCRKNRLILNDVSFCRPSGNAYRYHRPKRRRQDEP